MTFLILSVISGFLLIVLPIVAVRKFRTEWKTPKKLFMYAGLSALMVETIHAAVLGNGTDLWPQVFDLPVYLTAIIFGAISGLFTELGRFLILDKLMRHVRSFKEGLMFGMGWGGLQTILYGFVVIIGAIGMYYIVGISNLEAVFPEANKDDLASFTEIQQQSSEILTGNPLLGLAPLVERASLIAMDIALTLMIILALLRGLTSLVWTAVGLRTISTASVIYLNSLNPMLGETGLIIFGIIAFFIAKRLSESFTVAPLPQ